LKSQNVAAFAWSPDGSALAFVTASVGSSAAQIFDLTTSIFRNLSTALLASNGVASFVTWAPDGKRVAYLPINGSGWVIADGITAPQVLSDAGAYPCNRFYPSLGWAPDSTQVAYLSSAATSSCSLATYNVPGNSKRLVSQAAALPDRDPGIRWLNDGKRVVFAFAPDASTGYNNLFVGDVRGTMAFKLSDQLDATTLLVTGLPFAIP
jgi:Tol biopolymer transport system component